MNLYGFIDPSLFLFLFGVGSRFMPATRRKYSLASAAPPHPRHRPPISRRFFFICDCPPLLTGFALSLLFQPGLISPIGTASPCSFTPSPHLHTVGKTVCSKDCNLSANLYGFLQGGILSPYKLDDFSVRCKDCGVLKVLCKLRVLFFFFFLFALGREKKKPSTYLDAPAVTG